MARQPPALPPLPLTKVEFLVVLAVLLVLGFTRASFLHANIVRSAGEFESH